MQTPERLSTLFYSSLLAAFLNGSAFAQVVIPVNPPELRPGLLAGYLPRAQLPDSFRLLPPPPAAGSAAQQADDAAHQSTLPLGGSARWRLAARDAVLKFPAAADVFSCTLGATISEKQTPHLYTLLRRSYVDAGLATYAAKDRYARVRPYMISKVPTCTPTEEAALAKDGAYPSGHAALGWAWGLLLAEMVPEKSQAVLERANAFGQSRHICGVHWLSDIAAGQLVASAAVARLHADPVFKAQFALAQTELQASMGTGPNEGLDCAGESAALASQP